MQSSYFESKVLTAPPYRLHLMLIEGAIRFGRQAEECLRRGEDVAAATPLLRVLDIVGEMLVGVRETKSDLTRQIADVYLFIFRKVSEAKINANANALGEALKLLEFERQTWQQLCEKLGSDSAPAKSATPNSRSFDSTSSRGSKAGVSWQA